MRRVRICSLWLLTTASLSALAFICAAGDSSKATKTPLGEEVRAILVAGSNSRMPQSVMDGSVARARRLAPNDPGIDYAFGLALMKRQRGDRADEALLSSLKTDPGFLPARQALFRLRMTRKEVQPLLDEAVSFAKDIADADVKWADEQSQLAAARFLGRVIGYLGQPETKIVPPSQLQKVEAEIERHLGKQLVAGYLDGIEEIGRDRGEIAAVNTAKRAQINDRKKQEVASRIEQLEKKKSAADEKAETLKVTKEESQGKFDAELKTIEQDLASLKEDHTTVTKSAERIQQMMIQTRTDIARLETELNLRGIRGNEARTQPALLRMQEELIRYNNQYFELERQAAQISAQADELAAQRAEMVERHRGEKGQMVQQIEAAKKRNQTLDKRSKMLKETLDEPNEKEEVAVSGGALNFSLLFPFDYQRESDRLLQQYGVEISQKTPPAPAKSKPLASAKSKKDKIQKRSQRIQVQNASR